MNKMQKIFCFLPLILGIANAELHVIADKGGESAMRFYEFLKPVDKPNSTTPNAIPARITEEDMLPVKTHLMKVCRQNDQIHNIPTIIKPIALVGNDEVSKLWLKTFSKQLQDRDAIGLVVSVNSIAEMQEIRKLVPNIHFLPISSDDIAKTLGIKCYPVIIEQGKITQNPK